MVSDNSARSATLMTASHWGPGRAAVENGRIVNVSGHEDDPDPSPINGNIASSLNGRARVLRPAVRESWLRDGPGRAAGRRGAEPFVEVSWDRALDLIAGEVTRVRGQHGNGAIYAGSYGWSSAGRFHHAQSQLKRFLNTVGGFVASEGNYSYNAALVLMPHIVGNFRQHVKEATRWRSVARNGELVVMFGGVPLRSAQVGAGGVYRHRLRADLEACREAGVDFVSISPYRNDAAQSLQAEWLAPRPGSDTAIMLGLAHTLLVEGLHDQAFLDRYTVGFDKLRGYLLGQEDGQPKDAEWAARQSGLDAQRLRALARRMAASRTLICTAVSLQRGEHGEQPLWATVTLASMLGQIGLPGGGYGIGYGSEAHIGTMDRPVGWPSLPQGDNPVKDFIPVAMISDMLLNPGQGYDYNGEKRVFPDVRLVWWAGGNPFHHHQDLNRLREAFQQPEIIIVNELNWTATARHADIVLPVAAPQERCDFGAGTQDNALIPMPKLVDPPCEARCEYDIYCDLAARLDVLDAFSEGRSSEDWLRHMWQRMTQTALAEDIRLPEWDEFITGQKAVEFPDRAPEHVFLGDFRADPRANALPTPSGRIELYSQVIAGFDYADCPGHAAWLPPREWLGNRNDPDLLHMVSGQPATRLHSQLDNGDYSRSRKVGGREPVLINPADAQARGIADGDIVLLHNDRGRCLAGAVLTEDIRPGVVFLWTGAWYDPDLSDPQHLDRHGNPNVLTHDWRTSRLSQGPAAHSALVRLARFEGVAPDIRVFDQPDIRSADSVD
ncbi:molybdopterin-dependent oxidoreductase [Paracoccus seriniphilus]|uniref:molybdopterin-dependent oxidoreductase n=1 Tax=Paracoccus seriniphilus TaxID=184748 RepID=UPI0035634467